MKALVAKGKVSGLKVVELKEWLVSQGLDTRGLKSDLVTRVEEYFENR
jgi:hypothetical protein